MSSFTQVRQLSNGNLHVSLSATGKSALPELLERYEKQEYYSFFVDLFDEGAGTGSIFGNGYDLVSDTTKGHLGLLTDSLVLGYDSLTDEETDEIIDYEKLWWFPDYQIVCPIKELLTKGEVIFSLSK